MLKIPAAKSDPEGNDLPHESLAQCLEIQKELKKNRGALIQCKLCSKKVKSQSYLNHRTLNGCPRMDPCFRLKNFKKNYEQ